MVSWCGWWQNSKEALSNLVDNRGLRKPCLPGQSLLHPILPSLLPLLCRPSPRLHKHLFRRTYAHSSAESHLNDTHRCRPRPPASLPVQGADEDSRHLPGGSPLERTQRNRLDRLILGTRKEGKRARMETRRRRATLKDERREGDGEESAPVKKSITEFTCQYLRLMSLHAVFQLLFSVERKPDHFCLVITFADTLAPVLLTLAPRHSLELHPSCPYA